MEETEFSTGPKLIFVYSFSSLVFTDSTLIKVACLLCISFLVLSPAFLWFHAPKLMIFLKRCQRKLEHWLKNQRTWSKSLVFRNYFFLWISTLQSPNQKTELDGMFICWCWFFDFFFILADKISRFAKSWLPIQNLNSVAVSKIPYLNWRYNFVRFSHDFCQNAWTSSLCVHLNNDVFWISTVVMWTRNAQVSFHNINSCISSIRVSKARAPPPEGGKPARLTKRIYTTFW